MKSQYIVIPINRLFHGFASVRSHIVEKAMQEGRGLKIVWNKKIMLIEASEVCKGYHNKEEFRSIHNEEYYHLVDYDFKGKKEPEQMNLLTG